MFSKTVLIAIFVAVFSQLSQQKTVKPVKRAPDFSGCDDEYQCFGLPTTCLDKEEPDCQVLLKTQALDDGVVEFNLIWERPSNSSDSWVAAALSSDNMMGDDSATIFIINENSTVKTEEGLTFIRNGSGGVTEEQVTGITMEKHKYVDGRLTAKWTRAENTTVGKMNFDMKANKYYILLAYGPIKDGHIRHHNHQGVSSQAINLEEELNPKSTTTSGPKTTTKKPSNAPTITSSLFLSIFAAIILILN